ncbi:MAG: hypothetical protein Kow00107_10670 [Planctomycetota bacterium]
MFILDAMKLGNEWLDILEFGSVIEDLCEYCETPGGVREAKAVSPIRSLPELSARLADLREVVSAGNPSQLPSAASIEYNDEFVRLCKAGSPISPSQFRQFLSDIKVANEFSAWFCSRSDKFPRLAAMARAMPNLSDLADEIDVVVDQRDKIRDTASQELQRIRRSIVEIDERIAEKLKRITRNPEVRKILQFNDPTFSGERYVLAVKSEMRSRFHGILHYTSDSGATSFMEPYAVIADTNELAQERSAEKAEERRLLSSLAASVGRRAHDISDFFAILSQLDLICAKARYAADYDCCVPSPADDFHLELKSARHPKLVHKQLTSKVEAPFKVVANDISLGSDYLLLVVTGPNTGGKTVVLKTVGLLSLMALSALPVPAAKAVVPLYDCVFADIGDEQSIEQNLSTFSSHIQRISRILQNATSRSLVLLDELGAGTDPNEGAALGRAILEHLVQRGISTVVTTHIGTLKTLAFSDKRIQNAGMEFDLDTLQPLFSIRIGQAGESRALQIALRLGLDPAIIAKSREFVVETDSSHIQLWNDLQRLRKEVEKDKEEARRLRDEGRKASEESTLIRDEWRKKMKELQAAGEKERGFAKGDEVYIRLMRENGVVLRVSNKGQAVVLVKGREVTIPVADLEPPRK